MNLKLIQMKSAAAPGGYEYRGMDLDEVLEWFRKHADTEGALDEDVRLFLDGAIQAKAGEPGAPHLWVMSDFSQDRDKERIDPAGWQLKNYKKNPIVLWSHLWWEPAIGLSSGVHVRDNGKGEKELVGRVKFDTEGADPQAMLIASKVANGIIRTGSVGFQPLKVEFVEGDEDKAKGDGTRLIHRKQELMEFSACNVPSNVNAMIVAEELNSRSMGTKHFVVTGMPEKSNVSMFARQGVVFTEEQKKEIEAAAAAATTPEVQESETVAEAIMEAPPVEEVEKAVIPYKDLGIAGEDEAWDAAAEVKAADVQDLKAMCTWYDEDYPDAKASYKLPHHRQNDKKAVWRGCAAAMGALMGARGGVDMSDDERKGCHAHLSRHYKAFSKEPPTMESADGWDGVGDEVPITEAIPAKAESMDVQLNVAQTELLAALKDYTEALKEKTAVLRKEPEPALPPEKPKTIFGLPIAEADGLFVRTNGKAAPGPKVPSYIDGLFTDKHKTAQSPETRETEPQTETRTALDELVAKR